MRQNTHTLDTRGIYSFGTLDHRFVNWRMRIDTPFSHPPTVGNGLLAVALSNDHLLGIEHNTATIHWRQRIDGLIPNTLVAVERFFCIGTRDGFLHIFDQKTGKRCHRVCISPEQAQLSFIRADIHAPNLIWIATKGGTLVSVDVTTGTSIQTLKTGLAADLMVTDGLGYIATSKTLKAINLDTEHLLWQRTFVSKIEAIQANTTSILVLLSGKRFTLLNIDDGSLISDDRRYTSKPVLAQHRIFFVNHQKNLCAWDCTQRQELWEISTQGRHWSNITVQDKRLTFVDNGNALQTLDTETGELVWRWETPTIALPPASLLNAFSPDNTPLPDIVYTATHDILYASFSGIMLVALAADTGHEVLLPELETPVPVHTPRRVRNLTRGRMLWQAVHMLSIGVALFVLAVMVMIFFNKTHWQKDPSITYGALLILAATGTTAVLYQFAKFRQSLLRWEALTEGVLIIGERLERDKNAPPPTPYADVEIGYTYTDGYNYQHHGKDIVDDYSRVERYSPNTKVGILLHPRRPDIAMVPSFHQLLFEESTVNSAQHKLTQPPNPSQEFKKRLTYNLFNNPVLRTQQTWKERLWPSATHTKAVGRLIADASGLKRLNSKGLQDAVRIDWDAPFVVHLSVWPTSFTTAELNISIRSRDAGPQEASLSFKTLLPQAQLDRAIPIKQERFPHIDATAFETIWPVLAFHAHVHDAEVTHTIDVKAAHQVVQ